MPLIEYVKRSFSAGSMLIIEKANEIIEDYTEQGYKLTLRQLYYQFVSRDLIPNTIQSYNRLGSIVNDARLAGLIDWETIEDRTRNIAALPHWSGPAEIIDSCAAQFRLDLWEEQPYRVEVWIEKEALAGVFERVCNEFDVPYLCCRGYTSQSEMWGAAERLKSYVPGQEVRILHFGDHDPSGIDMTRDIIDRLTLFGLPMELERLALNMEQVRKYKPPPNPAKATDSRFAGYIQKFGGKSWELDALDPAILSTLVRDALVSLIDLKKWKSVKDEQAKHRETLGLAAAKWSKVSSRLLNGSM